MSIAARSTENSYYQLKVSTPVDQRQPLTLTFTDKAVATATALTLIKLGYEITPIEAYKLFTEENDTVEIVRLFLGKV